MAHKLTPDEVDQLAAAAAAGDVAPHEEDLASPLAAEPLLAYGAQGDKVTKLVNVLAVLGFNTNDVVKGGPPKLDESVLVDVRAAQAELGISEVDVVPAADVAVAVEGELVGNATWSALYEAAAAKLEQQEAGA
jgi:peptidoglycan hydrolase-like protein with peptidoglycan-binding domain